MKLNARQVETAKPAEKDYKMPDGNGLILLVKTSGGEILALSLYLRR
ncbi:Integrase [Enterobacter asburiae]|uniref:Integrase n=1 Tax=Enterobacter asburiae TaxID=61645 RepID=A0A376EUU8_ENTAS|nr:Integrase [Enterobacter asburiae]